MASFADRLRNTWQQGIQRLKAKPLIDYTPIGLFQNAKPASRVLLDTPGSEGLTLRQSVQQNAPNITGQNFGNFLRRGFIGRDGHPLWINKPIQPILNMLGNTGQTVGSGTMDTLTGTHKAITDPSLLNKAAGVGEAIYGIGKIAAAGDRRFQALNTLASMPQITEGDYIRRAPTGFLRGMTGEDLSPEVKLQKNKYNVLGYEFEVDPVAAAGQMIGFTQNPINRRLFGMTNAWTPFKGSGALSKGASWLANNATRGAVEDILMSSPDLPENASYADKIRFIKNNALTGAGMEIGARGLFDSLGFVRGTGAGQTVENEFRKALGKAGGVVGGYIQGADGKMRGRTPDSVQKMLKDEFVKIGDVDRAKNTRRELKEIKGSPTFRQAQNEILPYDNRSIKLDNRFSKTKPPDEALGLIAGIERDEEGNITFNPEKALLGITLASMGTRAFKGDNAFEKEFRELARAVKENDRAKALDIYMKIPDVAPEKDLFKQAMRNTGWYDEALDAMEGRIPKKSIDQMLKERMTEYQGRKVVLPEDEAVTKYFTEQFSDISNDPNYWDILKNSGWDKDKIENVAGITQKIIKEQDIKNPPGFMRYMLRQQFPSDEILKTKYTDADIKLSDSDRIKAERAAQELEEQFAQGGLEKLANRLVKVDKRLEVLRDKHGITDVSDKYIKALEERGVRPEVLDRYREAQKLVKESQDLMSQARKPNVTQGGLDEPKTESVREIINKPANETSEEFVKGFTKDESVPYEIKDVYGSVEEASENANAAKNYITGRISKLRDAVNKLGLSEEEYFSLRESGGEGLTGNIKAVYDEYDDIADEAIRISGADVQKRPDWGVPRIWEESRKKEAILPNTFIDKMNEKFLNILPRIKNKGGYIQDPFQALQDYSERAIVHRFWDVAEAQRRGVSVDLVKAESNLAEEVAENIRKDNYKTDTIGKLKEIKELKKQDGVEFDGKRASEMYGVEPEVKKMKAGKIATASHNLRDARTNLKNAGLWEQIFEPVHNYKAYARRTYRDIIQPLVVQGDIDTAIAKLKAIDSELDVDKLRYFASQDAGDMARLEGTFLYATERSFHNASIDNLVTKLSNVEFPDGRTYDYVNEYANIVLGKEVKVQDTATKILNETKRTIASGALGFNVSSMLNNFLEVKRVLPVTNANSLRVGVQKAASDSDNILELYGVSSWDYEDFFKNIEDSKVIKSPDGKTISKEALLRLGRKTVDGKHKIDDAVLAPFKWSEEFKDKIFLYALDADATAKGLEGSTKTKFVLDNFNEFANKFGGLNTVGMFRNKYTSTIFQFGQYALKEAGIYWDKTGQSVSALKNLYGDTTEKGLKDAWKSMNNHDKAALKYMTQMAVVNTMLIYGLGKLLGYDAERVIGATPFDIGFDDDGINLGTGVLPGLAIELFNGIVDDEEGIITDDLRKQKNLLFPAGNQVLNKTRDGIQDMLQGYNESATGLMRFPTQQDSKANMVRSALFGSYSRPESSDYFDNDRRVLGEKQTDRYANLYKQNPELARQYYDSIIERRESSNQEDETKEKSIQKILKGEQPIETATEQKIIQSRQDAVGSFVAQGITDPKEIADLLDEQARSSGFNASDFSQQEIKAYTTASQGGLSIMDIINKEAKQNKTRSAITEVMTGEDFEGWSNQDRMSLLQAEGITQQDVQDWQMWKLSNASPEDRASWIASNGRTDFVKLYEQDVISKNVLEELERKGYISDANDLWEKLKLSDPYVRKKAQQELQAKYTKKITETQAKTMEDILKAGVNYRKKQRASALKMLNQVYKSQTKSTNYDVKLRTNALPKPTPYKVREALKF